MKKGEWKKYLFEFLSIFVAVISAFALSNWNDNVNSKNSEQKILIEIKNGINIDQKDFESNIIGHNRSLTANKKFRELLLGKEIGKDSVALFYTALFRDYTPVFNRSGYESLKESGLKTIRNDSLRFEIIELYDYYYGIIDILDKVYEMQSFENYFTPVNDLLYPYMEFDIEGNLIQIHSPEGLTEEERKEIRSYLWRLDNNRKLKLNRYNSIMQVMIKVKEDVESEIKNNT